MRYCHILVILLATGCIPAAYPKAFTVTAATPTEVASCKNTQSWHNAWVVLGAVLGAASGAGGGITSQLTDTGQKLGVGIAAASSGALAALATAFAGVTAGTFSENNCPTVLQQAANATQAH
jgi:hypothetical protein